MMTVYVMHVKTAVHMRVKWRARQIVTTVTMTMINDCLSVKLIFHHNFHSKIIMQYIIEQSELYRANPINVSQRMLNDIECVMTGNFAPIDDIITVLLFAHGWRMTMLYNLTVNFIQHGYSVTFDMDTLEYTHVDVLRDFLNNRREQ